MWVGEQRRIGREIVAQLRHHNHHDRGEMRLNESSSAESERLKLYLQPRISQYEWLSAIGMNRRLRLCRLNDLLYVRLTDGDFGRLSGQTRARIARLANHQAVDVTRDELQGLLVNAAEERIEHVERRVPVLQPPPPQANPPRPAAAGGGQPHGDYWRPVQLSVIPRFTTLVTEVSQLRFGEEDTGSALLMLCCAELEAFTWFNQDVHNGLGAAADPSGYYYLVADTARFHVTDAMERLMAVAEAEVVP